MCKLLQEIDYIALVSSAMKYVFLRKKTRASPRMHIFWLFSAKSFKINHICETTDVFEQESKLVCLEAYLDSLQRPISQNMFNIQRLPTCLSFMFQMRRDTSLKVKGFFVFYLFSIFVIFSIPCFCSSHWFTWI